MTCRRYLSFRALPTWHAHLVPGLIKTVLVLYIILSDFELNEKYPNETTVWRCKSITLKSCCGEVRCVVRPLKPCESENYCCVNSWSFVKLTVTWYQDHLKVNKQLLCSKLSYMQKYGCSCHVITSHILKLEKCLCTHYLFSSAVFHSGTTSQCGRQ